MTESFWLKEVVTETIERAKDTPEWMNSEAIACRQKREADDQPVRLVSAADDPDPQGNRQSPGR